KALVRAANKGGGEDNITVVFFEIAGSYDDTERTVTLPPREEGADAEEDTLDELDRVPAAQPPIRASGPVEGVPGEPGGSPDGARPPRPEPRGHGARRALLATLALLLLATACGFVVWGLWRSHFVGAEPDGHVAVYQGVPWNIVGNVHL